MKKIIGFVLGGVFVGIFIGYSFGGLFSLQKKKTDSLTSDHSVKISDNKERELLLHAIENLNLKGADLKRAQAYIKKLERNIKRYNWVIAYWKKNGFNTFAIRDINFLYEEFYPDRSTIEFFGWDEETVSQIKEIAKESLKKVKDFEKQNAVRIETGDGTVVYNIPALPGTMKEHYIKSLEGVIGKDNVRVLSPLIERKLKYWGKNRQLTFSLKSVPKRSRLKNEIERKNFMIMIKDRDNDDVWPYNISFNISFSPNSPMFRDEDRWSHLLSWDLFNQKK